MNVVYVKNFENGKKYVGITNNFERRMRQHRCEVNRGNQLPIYRAMRKYDHYTEVVFESENYDDITYMEQVIIQNFKDLGIELYNITNGGEGMVGFHHSEESKAKMRANRKDTHGENHPMYGKKHSEESIDKMRMSSLGCCKGGSHYLAKDKSHYETYAVSKAHFKTICSRQGWNLSDFEEVFNGEYYKNKDGKKLRKLFNYIYKGDDK